MDSFIKKLLPLALLPLLASCQQYEPYTREQVFKGAYNRNFVRTFGAIDPTIDWDFSDQRPTEAANPKTRSSVTEELDAITTNDYFYVDKSLFSSIKDQIQTTSKTDRSFAFQIEEGDCFDIYPVYLTSSYTGSLQWVFQMFVGNENKISFSDSNFPGWKMGENVGVRIKEGGSYMTFTDASKCQEYGLRSKRIIRFTNEGGKELMHFDLYLTSPNKNYAIKGSMQSCLNYQMRILDVPKPDNIGSNLETLFVACDAADMDVQYVLPLGRRYQSLVFMIVGPRIPKVLYVREDSLGKRWIDNCISGKRYMIEDLGSASDFDFNDVVVDVEKIEPTEVEITQNSITNAQAKLTKVSLGQSQPAESHAIVRFLCGTRPFKLYVGDSDFGLVTDPTNQPQTKDQLLCKPLDYEPTYFQAPMEITGWNPDVRISVPDWDTDANKVSIEVWPNGMADVREGGWKADFPSTGDVPFMMALPTSTKWSSEGVLFTDWKQYLPHI